MTLPLPSRQLWFAVFFLVLALPGSWAQSWNFEKEKDGIRIYTRKEPGTTLRSFRGVADIRAPMEKVNDLIGNVRNVDWWDKNVKEITILKYEKDRGAQYYLVYDAPWPVSDRDLCVESHITTDPATGIRTVYAEPLKNMVPEKPDRVRIKKYWQRWVVEPRGKNLVHVVLEGFVDPAGSVPEWVYNMVITGTPLRVMGGIKEKLEKQPVKD